MRRLFPSIRRSLNRGEATPFRRDLRKAISLVEKRSPAGLIVGEGREIRVDGQRLKRFGNRLAQALYYHHFKRFIPDRQVSSFLAMGRPWARLGDENKVLLQGIIQAVESDGKVYRIGDGTFTYAFLESDDRQRSVAWLLSFFDRVRFLCFTIPGIDDERLK